MRQLLFIEIVRNSKRKYLVHLKAYGQHKPVRLPKAAHTRASAHEFFFAFNHASESVCLVPSTTPAIAAAIQFAHQTNNQERPQS
jgi:hypothetical protein